MQKGILHEFLPPTLTLHGPSAVSPLEMETVRRQIRTRRKVCEQYTKNTLHAQVVIAMRRPYSTHLDGCWAASLFSVNVSSLGKFSFFRPTHIAGIYTEYRQHTHNFPSVFNWLYVTEGNFQFQAFVSSFTSFHRRSPEMGHDFVV